MFDIYRQASESWWRLQQELFDGLYKSAMLLFPRPSRLPEAKSSDGNARSSGAIGSKTSKATRKAGAGTSRRSRKVAGSRPERPGAGHR